jgi:Spy/CpxP family protein refolding chaperone
MIRVRSLFVAIVPALLAGGLLLGTGSGHASAGDDPEEMSPYAADGGGAEADDGVRHAPARRTADARRRGAPPTPPAPPAPPAPPSWDDSRPLPPLPPAVPPPGGFGRRGGAGGPGGPGRISISIHDGKVQLNGIQVFARHQLDAIREMVRANPNIPADVRDKLLARLDKARIILDKRLKNLPADDLDKLGDELEKMGEELEKAMEGLEADLDSLGDKVGKDLAKKLGKDFAKGFKPGRIYIDRGDHDGDHDADANDDDDGDDHDDHGVPVPPGADIDADAHDAVRDLKGLTLQPAQRDQIAKLRAVSEQQIATARKQLDDASKRLEVALADPKTSDAEISRYIDQVSMHEAAIRKARLLTWVNARRLLDDGQRKKIEDAAKKGRK